MKVLHGPLVLLGQLLQALSLGQRPLQPLNATEGVVLGLVKDLLGLEEAEHLLLSVQSLLGVEQFGQLVDINVRLRTLLGEQLGTLRARGLEGLDPVRRRRRHDGVRVEGGMKKEANVGRESIIILWGPR